MPKCEVCNKKVKDYDSCYQVRYGALEDNDFIPISDLGYIHPTCLPKKMVKGGKK